MRRRVQKTVAAAVVDPRQVPMFSDPEDWDDDGESVVTDPCAYPTRKGAAPAFFFQGRGAGWLVLYNHDRPLVMKLRVARKAAARASVEQLAKAFTFRGNRFALSMEEPAGVQAELSDEPAPFTDESQAVAAGEAEFGLQTADDHEYFVSGKGGFAGIVRVRRKDDGGWVASVAKTFLPRVLSKEAVAAGLMPPPGVSALPTSLERVVPREYRYWEVKGENARQVRDALVESNFLNESNVQLVDGRISKVEVKFYLYEPSEEPAPDASAKRARKRARPSSLAAKVAGLLDDPRRLGANPFDGDGDWVDRLEDVDREGTVVLLSAPTTDSSVEEIARAALTLRADFIVDVEDSPAARAALTDIGPTFKLRGEPSRLFAASFAPRTRDVAEFVHKVDGMSMSQLADAVNSALRAKFPPQDATDACCGPIGPWARDVYDDRVIYMNGGDQKSWQLGFTVENGAVVFQGEPIEVQQTWTPVGGDSSAAAPETPPADGATDAQMRDTQKRGISKVVKTDENGDERYVLGIVLEPDIIDAQNDTYSAEEVRAAEQIFMEQYGTIGLMHERNVSSAVKILESYIAPVEFKLGDVVVKAGTWLMAVRVLDDKLWSACKAGDLTGFSIGGTAVRTPVDRASN